MTRKEAMQYIYEKKIGELAKLEEEIGAHVKALEITGLIHRGQDGGVNTWKITEEGKKFIDVHMHDVGYVTKFFENINSLFKPNFSFYR